MKLELCAASIEAVDLAKELKFDRIELCQNLEQGGMTPSPGFIEYALSLEVETHVLIRPRSGGFRYTKEEIEIVLRDVKECKSIGAQGVVVGVLDQSDQICKRSLDSILSVSGDMDVTFHRAFDDTYEYDKSLDVLINAGVKRVLTSGLARNVELGMPVLKNMNDYANGRIEIMTGGGVSISNILKLKNEVKPSAIHFSGTNKTVIDEESMFSETVLKPNRDKIIRLLEVVR
ncbi:MAG: copper homeostasis protein CutC [Crocinitomicaceae bacterium]|nr:copper homeostasis protein CutC [Flavobacteriales bacterium]NQZ38162.1 copper homeostasis protein CutC [Crocinitomicaceae bacterium]